MVFAGAFQGLVEALFDILFDILFEILFETPLSKGNEDVPTFDYHTMFWRVFYFICFLMFLNAPYDSLKICQIVAGQWTL